MKIKGLVFALMTACAGVAVPALAHPGEWRGEHREHRGGGWHDGDDGRWDGQYRWRDDGGYRRRYWDHEWHRMHHHRRGAGPYFDLWVGDRLPMAFWGPRYRVVDWRAARLGPPMYGCQWVRVGGDYVQVSVSTGLIAAVLLSPR
jgi:Ni/Co efflux regulator RcnB